MRDLPVSEAILIVLFLLRDTHRIRTLQSSGVIPLYKVLKEYIAQLALVLVETRQRQGLIAFQGGSNGPANVPALGQEFEDDMCRYKAVDTSDQNCGHDCWYVVRIEGTSSPPGFYRLFDTVLR